MEVKQITQGLTAASALLRQRLQQFITWWTGELLALLPQQLREMMQRRARRLIVDVDGKKATFTLCGLQGVRKIVNLDFGPNVVAQSWAVDAIKKACAGHVDEIAVRIPVKQALRRTLTIPLAAEENLREVLAFEMDRHSPFKAEHVYYDFRVIARDPAKRSLRVELTVVPRSKVDPLVEMLISWDLEPTSLDIRDGNASDDEVVEAAGLNLFPVEQRRIPQGDKSWQNWILAALAAVLLVIAIALPFVHKINAGTQLETEVKQARQEALTAEQVRTELEQLVAEVNALVKKRKERPTVIQVLDELTRLLPDSTWLSRLEVGKMRAKIRGESFNASDLATLIENSALFNDASFDSPVTRNPNTDRERFVISATVARVDVQ
jgi:general secretion pathway protein L